jgi:autotransporter strand-loop-strand O-heptosyltransferase
MRICQVTPGLISIPPNGWGAVEKIIWEYKQSLERLGHTCDIKYLNDVRVEDYDIVHIHVANLALIASERNIPYVFTMHDHHTEVYGKDSVLYKQNREAIEKSVVSFVPAKHLVSYFDSHRVKYLRHGTNTSFFKPGEPSNRQHKLLCVGRNGLADDMSFDRKGFVYAIEAARKLDLEITVAGPTENKEFFENNKDFKHYDKLTLLYDLNEEDLLKVYQDHTIFLHPSSVEAGHPNLTLVEALSCGLPVVSTYDSDGLPGMVKIQRDVESVYDGVCKAMNDYRTLCRDGFKYATTNDWNHVVDDLVGEYRKIDEYRMKNELNQVYDLTVHHKKQEQGAKVEISYIDGASITVNGGDTSVKYNFEFIDDDVDECLYSGEMKTNEWSKCLVKRFVPYRIKLYANSKLILNDKINLKEKEILICLDTKSLGDCIAWFPYIEEFRKTHQCKVTCATNWSTLFQDNYPEINFIGLEWSGHFYAIYMIGCYPDSHRSEFSYKDVSLQRVCSSILRINHKEIKPKLSVKNTKRVIEDRYVCFATHSTAQAKFWNNPNGWQEMCDYLNSIGLKPVLIQSEQNDDFVNIINKSGPKDIHDTINLLYNCEFFVGIGSGLSWLSWALNKPTVLISGFSLPRSEFYTPYRVINTNVCHGCWNTHEFNKGDWNWCPEHKDTDRQFECSKQISSQMVIDKINELIKTESIHTS